MHEYEIVIYWSDEDRVFVAEAPNLSGCAAHGETRTAVLVNINQAIELWPETAIEFGDQIPQPSQHKLAA